MTDKYRPDLEKILEEPGWDYWIRSDRSMIIRAPNDESAVCLGKFCQEQLQKIAANLRSRVLIYGKSGTPPIRIELSMIEAYRAYSGDHMNSLSPILAVPGMSIIFEELASRDGAGFLVSLRSHKNAVVNQQGLELIGGVSIEEACATDLRSLWSRDKASSRITPTLEEMIRDLRQRSELPSYRYEGWKRLTADERRILYGSDPNAPWDHWVEWVTTIRHVHLDGYGDFRLMLSEGWEPKRLTPA